jgi:signal transduction histidine kinase/response regulator of citrate/malate metabolism
MVAIVAIAIAALVLLALVWAARMAHLRNERVTRRFEELRAAYAELEVAKTQAEARSHQLRATLAGISDGVMMLNSALRLVLWNDHFADFTGLPRDMLHVGLPMAEMLRAQILAGEFGPVADPQAEVQRRVAAIRASHFHGVKERRRPDGRVIELRRRMLPDGGFVTLYIDVTARKQAEVARMEARRVTEIAVEQKAQFVAMVSHEIRVPLNAVISSLALLEQSDLSDEQRALADTAHESGATLLDLVDDILDLSKMDADRLELRPTDFDLASILMGVRDMFGAQAASRGITLGLTIALDVPARLHADAGRLRQVLMNFISNASKFANPGVVTISATMASSGAGAAGVEPPCLRLAVRDQGPVVPAQDVAGLFQPFAQLEYARAAGAHGTGLGLAICERLARLMGGQIGVTQVTAENSAAAGNEFWLMLPLSELVLNPPTMLRELLARPLRRASVLLVEDISTNGMLTASLLRRQGHRVDVAQSGINGLRMVTARPYDMVFMDLAMPGIDGCETARRIRALPGPEGAVPIVALTANDSSAAHAACLEAGMNSILVKPVHPHELFEVLGRFAWPMPALESASAGVSARSEALVDSERLADLQRSLPEGLFETLVEQCLVDIRERIPLLQDALRAGRPVAANEVAHALAGMGGSYGLTLFERRMRDIMVATAVSDMAVAAARAHGMESELDRSTELLRALLRARAA